MLLEATLIQICNLPDLQKIANLAAAAETIAAAAPNAGEKKKRPVNSPPTERQSTERPRFETPPVAPPMVEPQVDVTPIVNVAALKTAANVSQGDANASSSAVAVLEVAVLEPVTSTSVADQTSATDAGTTAKIIDTAVARWDQPTAQRVWHTALSDLESMTETFTHR